MLMSPRTATRSVKHPAPYSEGVIRAVSPFIEDTDLVLDPFAGIGRVHTIHANTYGVEIEPEWAAGGFYSDRTLVGNALSLPFRDDSFDVIFTSPTYGNRMADHHHAKDGSKRITYRHMLGRPLNPANSGQLQWGKEYRLFHLNAWLEAVRVLRPGGRFILNISDHIRKGEVQPVSAFHNEVLLQLGLVLFQSLDISTRRMRFGANGNTRVAAEHVKMYNKPL